MLCPYTSVHSSVSRIMTALSSLSVKQTEGVVMDNDDRASQDASTGGHLKQNSLLNAGDVWRGGTGRRPEGFRSWSSCFFSCQVFSRVWCLFDHFLNHSTVLEDVWWWYQRVSYQSFQHSLDFVCREAHICPWTVTWEKIWPKTWKTFFLILEFC